MKINFERAFMPGPAEPGPTAESQTEEPFGARLTAAIEDLERITRAADHDSEGMVAGTVDMHEALVSMEKADIALRFGSNVRNKLLEAYQTLSQTS